MTISSALGFDPIWSNFNITGVSAGGAQLFSFDSLNPSVFKPIFSDPGLNFPYPQPILFDLNGNAPGPFYFALDSTNPTSLYDLFLYDASSNLIWNVNSYFPSTGSGGSVTSNINLNNLIINNVFWRNIGSAEPTPVPINITSKITALAPGAHDGLSLNVSPTPGLFTANAFGPDIYFIKNNTSATETITFTPFPLGSTALTPDETPVQFVNHQVTAAGSSESYRYYQFPVSAKVQNISNMTVTVTIWAKGVSGNQTISLQWAQFFGDGTAPTATAITTFATQTLSASWIQYKFTVVVPNTAGSNLGECGNDGLFLLISLPLTSTFSIDFAKPSVYIGSNAPQADFTNYDVIDAAINSPRTGDTRTTLNNFQFGYVPMNDGTIGSAASPATTRKSIDTFPLYNLIWNATNSAWAPMGDGFPKGLSAIADFTSNRSLTLTKALGRVFAGTLNTEITQTINFTAPPVPTTSIGVASSVGFGPGVPVQFITVGVSTLPVPLQFQQGSTTTTITYYANIVDATHISISETPGGSLITLTTSGTGTIDVKVAPYELGQYLGEELHSLTVPEVPHNDPTSPTTATGFNAQPFLESVTGHNTLQPTTYMNMFIKL